MNKFFEWILRKGTEKVLWTTKIFMIVIQYVSLLAVIGGVVVCQLAWSNILNRNLAPVGIEVVFYSSIGFVTVFLVRFSTIHSVCVVPCIYEWILLFLVLQTNFEALRYVDGMVFHSGRHPVYLDYGLALTVYALLAMISRAWVLYLNPKSEYT